MIITLVGAAATAALGQWQMNRASQKEQLHAHQVSQAALPTLSNTDLIALTARSPFDSKTLLDRKVDLQGKWLNEHTLFLENRQMNQRQGLFVLTPFELKAAGQHPAPVLIVQRGWVPRNFVDRARLPEVATPSGELRLQGRLTLGPSKLYEFKGADEGKLRQNVTIPELAIQTGLALLPFSLQQTQPVVTLGVDDSQLLRNWPELNFGVDKHLAYAFQWFSLSALIVGLFVWFGLVQPRRNTRL